MKQKEEMADMEAQENKKEPNFWTCKHGYFAGFCRCRKLTGYNECLAEKGGMCRNYDEDTEGI